MSDFDVNEQSSELFSEDISSDGAEGGTEVFKKDTFTEAEAKAMAESEAKRRVGAAQRKWERELRGKLEEERARALSEGKAESDAVINELRVQLEASEKNRLMRERELQCTKALEEMGLPLSLVPFAADEDEDVMASRLDTLGKAVAEAVTRSVKERLGDMTPRSGARSQVSRFAIRDMSLAQLQRIYESGKTV